MNTIVESVRKEAMEVISKLSDNAAVTAEIESNLDAKEVTERGAVHFMVTLRRLFTDAVMNAWPVPGSTDGNNPDLHKYQETKTDGGTAQKTVSFYSTVCELHPIGASYRSALEALAKAERGDADADDEMKAWGDVERDAFKQRMTKRLSNFKTLFRKAVALHHQFAAINSLKGIEATLLTIDDEGTPIASPACIWVRETANPKASKVLNQSQFLAYKPAKMVGEGWEALQKTMDRKPAGSQAGKAKDGESPKANTVATFEACANAMLNGLDDADVRSKLMAHIAKGKDNETFIETLGDLIMALDDIWSNGQYGFQSRYDALKRKAASAAKAEAEAKAA